MVWRRIVDREASFEMRRVYRRGPYGRAVGRARAPDPRPAAAGGRARQTLARSARRARRHPLDLAHRRPLARPARALPPYHTCHRRFQRWAEEGVLAEVLRALAEDLKERGGLDLSERFIAGAFVGARKGGDLWERPGGAMVRSSWRRRTLLVFLSPYARRALLRTRSPPRRGDARGELRGRPEPE